MGMSRFLLLRRIILPKAFRLAWPAYTNEVVFLLQASSLVSIITIMDITGVARVIASRSFAIYEMYIAAAIIYLILVYGLLFVFRKIERRITRHLRSRPQRQDPMAHAHHVSRTCPQPENDLSGDPIAKTGAPAFSDRYAVRFCQESTRG